MLGFPILYCKGMRPVMFQLSGFCYMGLGFRVIVLRVIGFRVRGSEWAGTTVDGQNPALPIIRNNIP